jgi:hypothetical protein
MTLPTDTVATPTLWRQLAVHFSTLAQAENLTYVKSCISDVCRFRDANNGGSLGRINERNCIVFTANRYELGLSRFRTPVGPRRFLLTHPDRPWGPISLLYKWYWGMVLSIPSIQRRGAIIAGYGETFTVTCGLQSHSNLRYGKYGDIKQAQ